MITHDLPMATKAGRRYTSYAHSHKIFGYIAGADVVYEYQAQQIFKISGNFIR